MKTTAGRQSKWRQLSRLLTLVTWVALSSIQVACVHQSERRISPSSSATKISALHSFYVRQHAKDDHNLAKSIADELQKMGYTATHGTTQAPPQRVDSVVTYTDRWMWDITMYMLSLDMEFRDPKSDAILTSAKVVRTSLVRKSQQGMVEETLGVILGKEQKR